MVYDNAINGNFYKLQFDNNMIKNIHFYVKKWQ